MKVLIIDNGTTYLQNLQMILADYQLEIVTYASIPKDISIYNFIILTGGHSMPVNQANEQHLFKEINLIRNTSKPILGICYGFELLAYTYGCVIKHSTKIKGIREIMPIAENEIFLDIPKLSVFENHEYCVDELSEDLVGIAKSISGYEIIKHKTKPHYGFQFHPEMIEDDSAGVEIFRNLIEIFIGLSKVNR